VRALCALLSVAGHLYARQHKYPMAFLPQSLHSDRLRLRAPLIADAAHIFATYGQDASVARYMIWRPHTDVRQTEEFIADCLQSWEGDGRCPYILTLLNQREPIGMLDARFHGHIVDVGYVLARSHWGKGLMPEAIGVLVRQLFALPVIYRVQATCDVENVASRRTLEKSGFICEAILRSFTVHPNMSEVPRDCFMYARCRSDA
jgi:[ribosomal protein S5]-alanine N-acetyltransferase